MLFIPNQPIEIIPLPQTPVAVQQRVYFPRSKAFPTAQQLFQSPVGILHDNCMHVIWHHYRRNDDYPFPVEVAKRLSHDFCAITAPQNAGAMASVEPVFHRA